MARDFPMYSSRCLTISGLALSLFSFSIKFLFYLFIFEAALDLRLLCVHFSSYDKRGYSLTGVGFTLQ